MVIKLFNYQELKYFDLHIHIYSSKSNYIDLKYNFITFQQILHHVNPSAMAIFLIEFENEKFRFLLSCQNE